jgi:hypothetical protein
MIIGKQKIEFFIEERKNSIKAHMNDDSALLEK